MSARTDPGNTVDTRLLYIGGRWVSSTSPHLIDVVDPASEQVTHQVPAGSIEDVDAAVEAAAAALAAWRTTSVQSRHDVLTELLRALRDDQDAVVDSVVADLGCSRATAAEVHLDLAVDTVAGYRDALVEACADERRPDTLICREPIGVVAAVTPWNYPIYQTTSKVAAAIATGCTVVLKPSELAPRSAVHLFRLLDEIGLPPGVANLVSGPGHPIGEHLVSHPTVRMVSFTGSTRAGRIVASLAAASIAKVTLELGGKSAAVLLPGGDLTEAVTTAVDSAFTNSGQSCSALTRLLVPREEHQKATDLAARLAADRGQELGPLISAGQWDRVQSYLEQGTFEGATLAAGGPGRPEGKPRGYYVRPTVFANVDPDSRIAQEEIFGPVLCVIPYDDPDHALRIANSTDYGLSGAVWGPDPEAEEFARRMETGRVDVNGGLFSAAAPFGGYKQSGTGRELGLYGLREFLEVKALQLGAHSGTAEQDES